MEYTLHDTGDFPKSSRRLRTAVFAVLTLVVSMCLLIMPVMAHAPTGMTIAFDQNTAKISVTITHPVADPTTHYIRQVQAKHNDRVISDPPYKSQPTRDTFTYTYDVTAHSGDTVRVIATCVIGGTLEKTYDIPEPVRRAAAGQTMPPAAVLPTPKAAAGLLFLLGIAVVILCRKN